MIHIDLLRKIAWSYHNSTGFDWDDLFQEATIAYLRAIETWDESKGKPSTYIWRCVNFHLNHFLWTYEKQTIPSIPLDMVTYPPSHAPIPFWEALSSEAQEIAKFVLSRAIEFVVLPQQEAQEKIQLLLLTQGWNKHKVEKGLTDLRNTYRKP